MPDVRPLVWNSVARRLRQMVAGDTLAWALLSGVPAFASRWPTFAEVQDKPGTYQPSPHTHPIAQVDGLQAALNAKASLTAAVTFQDITASRGDNSGAIFFGNRGDRYIYWNGGHFSLGTATGDHAIWHDGNFNPATKLGNSGVTDHTGILRMLGNGKNIQLFDSNIANANIDIGAGYDNATDGHGYIANRWGGGFIEILGGAGAHRLRVGGPAGLTYNGHVIYNDGNVGNVLVRASANTAGFIRLTGPDAAYYLTDRTSFRDWAWYGTGDRMTLWGGTADVIQIDAAGALIRAQGGITIGGGGGGATLIGSAFGTVQIGMQNGGYCHFYTSAPAYYFDKSIEVDGEIRHYNGPKVPRTYVQASDPGAVGAGAIWIRPV